MRTFEVDSEKEKILVVAMMSRAVPMSNPQLGAFSQLGYFPSLGSRILTSFARSRAHRRCTADSQCDFGQCTGSLENPGICV
jgi:hypothetical protein